MSVTTVVALEGGDAVGGPGRVGPLETRPLANGGFAIVSNAPEGVQINLHNANGGVDVVITGATDASTGQIGAGDIVFANKIGDRFQFSSADLNGDGKKIDFFDSPFVSTNVDLATAPKALAAVSEVRISDTDRDIAIEIYGLDALGDTATLLNAFSADTSGAFDSDPKVAILKDGNVAVTWTRTTDPGTPGETSDVMVAVYGPAGGVVLGPTVLEGDNDVNRNPSIVATPDGGFAVAWQSRAISFGSLDIRLQTVDAAGVLQRDTLVTNRAILETGTDDGSDDAAPSVAAGADGLIAVSYTRTLSGDADTMVAIVRDGKVVGETQANAGNDAAQQTGSAVSFFGDGQLAAFDIVNGTSIEGQRIGVSLTVTGDAGGIVADDVIAVTAFRSVLSGLDGADRLTAGRFDDTLDGGAGADVLAGGDGKDRLDGGGGADRMTGGTGDDIYVVDNARDRVFEATGGGTADRVLTSATYALATGQEVELLATTSASGTGALKLTGNEKAQTLTGNAGANFLNGRGDADTMRGLGGSDIYNVDNAGDKVIEAAGGGTSDRVLSSVNYTLSARQEIELLGASSVSSLDTLVLTGNEKRQTINGNNGNNILDGKDGADFLRGFAGQDSFLFSTKLGVGNVDRILDFSSTDDTVRLENAVFKALTKTGTLNSAAFKDIGIPGASVDADDRILYSSKTGALFYDADGSGAKAAILFAKIDKHPELVFQDFIVV